MKRLEAVDKTYRKLMEYLPQDLRRIDVSDPRIKHGKLFDKRMGIILSTLMFMGLFCLSIVMIVYYLT